MLSSSQKILQVGVNLTRQNICMTFIRNAEGRQIWQNPFCLTYDFCSGTAPNLK